MPQVEPAPNIPSKQAVRRVNALLVERFGQRTVNKRDPLDGLILIILSQATSDVNCDRAFSGLKTAFPTWKECMDAPVSAVADSIRSGGLANQKAARIQQLLREIWDERGNHDLNFLNDLPGSQCEQYLSKFHGVGPKTIACVLVFFLDKPAFPVDTHVFRICKRLGWLRPKGSPDEAHRTLHELVPDECKLDLHVNLIAHGRLTCRADGNGGPKCGECSIKKFCYFGKDLKVAKSESTVAASKRDPDFFVTIKQKKQLETIEEAETASDAAHIRTRP
ncbi:endonuclease III [bacterium]|nr:MAG: endonuclease III [bacterium]